MVRDSIQADGRAVGLTLFAARDPAVMMIRLGALLGAMLCASAAYAADPPAATAGWSAAVSTATAAGYCLAKHPYQRLSSEVFSGYTRDGYEVVAPPGVVGAVRRNFVFDRTTDTADEGRLNSCKDACFQFGKLYGSTGKVLHQKVGAGIIITSGIGDIGSLLLNDRDFYLRKQVPVGAWSRGNTFQESDVAQSDYCCCQVTSQ